ncbi:MAG: hypothetical protein IID61_13825 [SAR324 cluster bacterium]|nr:hypothetical protein [SAR324 cluster bacterium]
MNRKEDDKSGLRSWLVPVALVHVICCGGLLLPAIIGSAAVATLTGYLFDPLVQFAGLALLTFGVGLLWRRLQQKKRRLQRDSRAATLDSPSN